MGVNTEVFAAELPEYLECPVCFGAYDDPQEVCEEAHVLCSKCFADCHGKSKLCPTCRLDMPSQPRPAKTLARIIQNLESVSPCFPVFQPS
ncbi:hypothetical protein JCM10213_000254 [Rhodosporidiobolus nylandii]